MFIRIYKFQDQNVLNNYADIFGRMWPVFENSIKKKTNTTPTHPQLNKPIIST